MSPFQLGILASARVASGGGGAVTYSGSVAGTIANVGTDVAVDLSTATAGDLALVLIDRYSATGVITTPAGWTLLRSASDGGRADLFYKVLGGGDIGTATFTWTGSSKRGCVAAWYSGVDPTTPIADSATGSAGVVDGSTPGRYGSLTTNEPMLVGFHCGYNTASLTHAAPSGYTERIDAGNTAGDIWLHIADTDGTWAGGTSDPTATTTGSVTYPYGFHVALAPA